MKKVVTCGCSFMSPDMYNPEFQGTHFSEVFAKEMGYELIQLARPGSSNGGICIQIEEAIKIKPDLILFGTTVFDRVEISVSPEVLEVGDRHFTEKIKIEELYDVYHTKIGEKQNAILLSDNLMSLIPDKNHWRDRLIPDYEIKHSALEAWLKHLYVPRWKRQIDEYCMYAVQHKLLLSGIKALKVIDLLESPDIPFFDCITGKKYSIHYHIVEPNAGSYHTTKKQQLEIVELIKQHLQ